MRGEKVSAEQACGRVHQVGAAHRVQSATDGLTSTMVTRQSQDPLGGLILGRFRRRHISETAPEQVGQFDLARAAQIEDQGNMIEARVPLHP
ncbi:hypothetical protein D3C81_1778400 [compost metagenome]